MFPDIDMYAFEFPFFMNSDVTLSTVICDEVCTFSVIDTFCLMCDFKLSFLLYDI